MHFLCRATIIVPASVALTFLVAGCRPDKVEECNKLAEAVNKGVPIFEKYEKEINKLDSAFSEANDPNALKRVTNNFAATMNKGASEVEGFSKELQTVEFKDETIKGYRDRLTQSFASYGSAFRDFGKSIESFGRIDFTDNIDLQLKKIDTETNAIEKKISQIDKDVEKLNSEKDSYCSIK